MRVNPHPTLPATPATASNASPAQLTNRLVKDLVQIFKLLSDETRLRILLFLFRHREMHVRALCDQLGQSQPAVSHHLALLRVAGLIEPRREGKHNFYRILPERFQELMEMVYIAVPEAEANGRFDPFANLAGEDEELTPE